MAHPTLWLMVAVEQYENLPSEAQASIDTAVAQLEEDPGGPTVARVGHSAHRAITIGDQDEHLVVYATAIGHSMLVITRIVR